MFSKNNFSYFFLAILCPLGLFAQTENHWQDSFRKIDEEVRKNSHAYSALKEATETIGHRLTGSPNGAKAEEFAYEFLKKSGFSNVEYQKFEVESWSRGNISLEIAPTKSDNFRTVKAVTLAHSPVKAYVENDIVDVGDGLEEDFEKAAAELKGKIALANIGNPNSKGKKNLHRSEKTALAIRYGAVGIIMVNQAPGDILLTGTASVTGSLIPIPATCISNASGLELRKWMEEEKPLRAKIRMTNQSEMITARNVVATLQGETDEEIIIGGHLDSWDLATGAIDNGIGSFSVLDIARTYAALKSKPLRTIKFVMFMGEEEGLLGSKYFVQQAVKTGEIDKIKYMLNFDMVNDPSGANAYGITSMEPVFEEIGKTIASIDTSFDNNNLSKAGLHSDHMPFMLEGVPVADLNGHLDREVLQCYHADCDHFDLVNKQQLENTVRRGAMYLYALANSKELNVKKLNSTQTRDYLISQGLKQELILGKEWKWQE